MMKRVVRILALIVVLPVFFATFFDLNAYKEKIEVAVSDKLDKEFRVTGDVKLGLTGWRPALALYGVKLDDLSVGKVGVTWPLYVGLHDFSVGKRNVGSAGFSVGLHEGGVSVDGIHGRLAQGGTVTGQISHIESKLDVALRVKKMDYRNFLDGMQGGNVKADVKLISHGLEAKQIRANMNGSFTMFGGEGVMAGTVLDLWGADLLVSLLPIPRKDKDTAIQCTLIDFEIKKGIAISRNFIIDTDRVTVFGKGSVNLAQGTMDMVFTPKPKIKKLIDIAAPVRVHGSFDNIKVTPDKAQTAFKIGKLLLGFVNPAAPLIPFLLQGTAKDNPCLTILQGKK